MHTRLQLINLLLLAIYASLFALMGFQLRTNYHVTISLMMAVMSILFWAYCILTMVAVRKKILLTPAWVNVIRFNVSLNLFFLLLNFIVLPGCIVLVTAFPKLTFLNAILDKFVVLFIGGIFILLVGNLKCFMQFTQNYLSQRKHNK